MSGPEPVRVELPGAHAGGYDVVVEAGLLRRLPDLLATAVPSARYAVLADGNVADVYGRPLVTRLARAGADADLLTVPPGEANKNRETWTALTDGLLDRGFGRDACVVALGGGVTSDLAGFVAATYMRGIALVQVPTTLLAMVDASIGGKTGVDTPAGKNLVGAFHQPRLVAVDPEVLATLPDAEFRAGLAETVKHGAIADEAYLRWIGDVAEALFRRKAVELARLVRRSVEIKAGFVAADVHEAGAREALNFGHTIGHALEALSDYRLPHGYAVAMGMVVEAELGEGLGITEAGTAAAIRAVLERLGLPVTLPSDSRPDAILERCRLDKKARAARTRYTLLRRLGKVAGGGDAGWAVPVDDGVVAPLLARAATASGVA